MFPKNHNSAGNIPDFEEPLEVNGQVRWQIIQVVTEGDISIGRANIPEIEDEDSASKETTEGAATNGGKKAKEKESSADAKRDKSNEDGTASSQGQEVVYKRGVYLFEDASLRELRNAFVETKQLDNQKGTHFQFLRSDVEGDKIEIETEDDILLNQIEHSLTSRRTMFIEMVDSGKQTLC